MPDLSSFNPSDSGELAARIADELRGTATDWWNENAPLMEGYVKTLAEAAMQTRLALLEKRVSQEQADIILHNQQLAFEQTLKFTRYMTLVLAQKLLDAAFGVVGWAIYNRTGINLAPTLVHPSARA